MGRSSCVDVAIIGISSLFPSANSTREYWDNLRNGVVSTKRIPDSRWEQSKYWDGRKEEKYKIYCPNGGFIDDTKRFDNGYFGIQDDEARILDPQQKVMLELTKKLFDDAGYSKSDYYGKNISLFIGASQSATTELISFYSKSLQMNQKIQEEIRNKFGETPWHPNLIPDSTVNLIAGRVSHEMNLKGPSMIIDTACSSALVALHYACRSLIEDEAEMAISGGVYLLNSAVALMAFSAAGALSERGILAAFDELADGFVPSEGAGLLLLKKLSAAQRDGDHIYAVVKGSTVNNDGHTLGVMAPNPTEQRKVIQEFYEKSEIKPNMIGYVEAHGTGTNIGDLSEFNSLSRVFSNWKIPANSIFLGSGKANIGHTIAASGVAGLIKVIGMMQDNCIYQQANFNTPNKKIKFEKSPFKIPMETVYFDQPNALEYVSLNSFGFGGTNAHVVVENGAKYNQKREFVPLKQYPVLIGAHMKEVLKKKKKLLLGQLEESGFDVAAFAFWNNKINNDYQWNVMGIVQNQDDLVRLLKEGKVEERKQIKNMLLFTGQGSQYLKMGKYLYDHLPQFKKSLDLCASLFEKEAGIHILEMLYGEDDEAALLPTQITQAAVFTIDYSLGRLLLEAGLKPSYMAGHSVGEWIAAVLAEVVSLEEGVRIICKRSELMGRVNGKGKMAAVFSGLENIKDIMEESQVYLSARNLSHIVVGGKSANLDRFMEVLDQKKIRYTMLKVASAFHTPLFSEIENEFKDYLDQFTFAKPKIPVIGNITGEVVTSYTGEYWAEHLVKPVLFEESINYAYDQNVRAVVECGGKNVLVNMIKSVPEYYDTMKLVNLLSSSGRAPETFSRGMIEISGFSRDFKINKVYEGISTNKVKYPEYPFGGKNHSLFVDFGDTKTHKWNWEPISPQQLKQGKPDIEINKCETGLTTKDQGLEIFISNLKEEIEKCLKKTDERIVITYSLPYLDHISVENYDDTVTLLFQFTQEILKVLRKYSKQLFDLITVSSAEDTNLNYSFHFAVSNMVMSFVSHIPNVNAGIVFDDGKMTAPGNQYYSPDNWIKIKDGQYGLRTIIDFTIKDGWQSKYSYDNKNILLIGGAGSIGEEICDYLINNTNARIMITGRSNHSVKIDKLLCKSEEYQRRVSYYSCNIADINQFKYLVDRIEGEAGGIDIVFHLAGIATQHVVCTLDNSFADIKEVLAPKVLGTMVIKEVFKTKHLDFLLMLSSVAATATKWSSGLADYSAANAFLNGITANMDYPAIALNYTLIESDSGLDAKVFWGEKNEMMKLSGLLPMSKSQAVKTMFEVLDNADQSGSVHIYEKYQGNSEEKLMRLEVKEEPQKVSIAPKELIKVENLESVVYDIISGFTKEMICDQNKYQNFMELGIDSLRAISLIESAKTRLNIILYPTIIFEYQTPHELYQYIYEQFIENEKDRKVVFEDGSKDCHHEVCDDEGIAIVGIDLKTAGSQSVEEFWENLMRGRNCITTIPEDHFISKAKNLELTGGYVEGVYDFDPMFFNISPAEAKYIDPQQRKFLESCYESLQSAGCLSEFEDKNIGVYVGVEQNNYNEQFTAARLVRRIKHIIAANVSLSDVDELLGASPFSADSVPGNSLNEIACRVSYTLGLTGPSIVLNTACSSSLVALSVATTDLLADKISAAVVGGVNLNLSDLPFLGLSQLNALSKTNSSRPFDQNADGMVLGEGIVSLVLKKVSKAKMDGNYIYGLVESVATNNNGFAQGLTVPSVVGQKSVIANAIRGKEEVYQKLRYIEAHGTATPLGDPIEMKSIAGALEGKLKDTCYIGSNKGNFGHSLAASGLLSIAKALGIMEYDVIPPIANFSARNANIGSLEDSMLELAGQRIPLSDRDYYIGVNAFGFGGTNAHVILKKYHNVEQYAVEFPQIVMLSHYSMEMIQRASKVLETVVSENNVGSILKRINCSSKIFPYKMAFVINDIGDFRNKLKAIQDGEIGLDIFHKRVNGKATNINLYTSRALQIAEPLVDVLSRRLGAEPVKVRDDHGDALVELLGSKSRTKLELVYKENRTGMENGVDLDGQDLSSLADIFRLMSRLFSQGVVFDLRNMYRKLCVKDENKITCYNSKDYRAREFKKDEPNADELFVEIKYENDLDNRQKKEAIRYFQTK